MAVSLRMISEDDLKIIMNRSRSEPETGFRPENSAFTLGGWKRWLAAAEGSDRSRYWAIDEDNTFTGIIYLKDIDWIHRCASWGYYMAETEQYSSDLAYILEMNLYDYCFDELELEEVRYETPGAKDPSGKEHPPLLNTQWEDLKKDRKHERIEFSMFFDRGGRPHHVGLEVADIAASIDSFRRLGWVPEGEIIYDGFRKVKLAFLRNRYTEGRLKLFCPDNKNDPASRCMGPYHMCYEVRDIGKAVRLLERRDYVLTSPPRSSEVFEGHKEAFLYNKNVGPVEILETDRFGNDC
ncbi:MAG: VOC family protein [Lachnospiraceae bacterium]|nr:VOC family protein [Lachnospiraceae bacterium]